jgi:serine protease Do
LAGLLLLSPALAQDRLHSSVLAAFRPIVESPAKSTVQVFSNGKAAALGAVVDADGYILTKASELKGRIECQLFDGRRMGAQLVGLEKNLDVALLKVDAKELPVVQWREGDPPPVGSWLATSGLGRDPVAIGVLSVGPRKIPSPAAAMGILLDNREDIARVASVAKDSPAEKVGIVPGDVIRQVNGKDVPGRQKLVETIRSYQPGDKVKLLVQRDMEELTIEVVLGSLTQIAHPEGMDRADFQNHLGGALSERRAGFPIAIQHDSVLKPWECGGPIVDLEGKVVGINIARAGRVESFALPASAVKAILPDLMSGKLNPNPDTQNVADTQQPTKEVKEEKKVQ